MFQWFAEKCRIGSGLVALELPQYVRASWSCSKETPDFMNSQAKEKDIVLCGTVGMKCFLQRCSCVPYVQYQTNRAFFFFERHCLVKITNDSFHSNFFYTDWRAYFSYCWTQRWNEPMMLSLTAILQLFTLKCTVWIKNCHQLMRYICSVIRPKKCVSSLSICRFVNILICNCFIDFLFCRSFAIHRWRAAYCVKVTVQI